MGVIAKYKFNNTLADLLPEFNSEFTSDLYTVTDEVNGNVTTRTIESDTLPTKMRFGRIWVDGESTTNNRTDSLLEVLDMNTSGLTSCSSMFRYNKNLTSIICNWDTSNVDNMTSMFVYCNKLTSLDLSNFDTSNVTNMYAMFYDCNKLTSLDVSNWDTSKVTNMIEMFAHCAKLISLDVSNWDTSKVTNMRSMFNNCTKLTTLDVSNWDTSEVTNMGYMFAYCNNITSLDVSNFDISNVTNMGNMFYSCKLLTTLNVSNWDTSNVTAMNHMFYECNNLTLLDLSNWNTNKVTSMQSMFYGCNNLISLDVNNWDTSNVADMTFMFYYCNNLISLDLSNWNTSNVTNMQSMFSYCTNLTSLDVSNFDTSNVINMFANTNNLKYLKCNNVTTLNTLNTQLPTKSSISQGTIICKSDITNLDTTILQSKNWNILDEPTLIAKYVFDKSIHNNCIPEFNTEFEGYFIEDEVVEGNNEVTRTIESCGMLPTLMRFGNNQNIDTLSSSLLEILDMDTSALTSMWCMFNRCYNLTSVSCNWNTMLVTNMWAVFSSCSNLTSLDVSNWDTSKVNNMNYLFSGCSNLTSLDVSNWDISNVTTMYYMFYNCSNLTSLDVSNWNTSNVINMGYMFTGCNKLTTLDVSNFNTNNVTDTTNMFANTFLLADISVLYMDKSSLQKLVNAIPTDSNKTLWYKDVNIDGITHGDNITLKKYIEGNVEIILNSPLLEGDRIEVKDGKLCHVHKRSIDILSGNETWWQQVDYSSDNIIVFNTDKSHWKEIIGMWLYCDKFQSYWSVRAQNFEFVTYDGWGLYIGIKKSKLSTQNINGFKQWLQANPTTVVYQLAEPYYEDITNLQSAPTLKTYLECSMEIDTDLPIDTKVTYRTNLSSVYVMERELDELDNGTDLGDILEGEVNE